MKLFNRQLQIVLPIGENSVGTCFSVCVWLFICSIAYFVACLLFLNKRLHNYSPLVGSSSSFVLGSLDVSKMPQKFERLLCKLFCVA